MQNEISQIAAEIDAIDEELVSLLRRRFERSRRIGLLKREAGLPSHDPTRVAAQKRRFVELCVGRGLDGEMGTAIITAVLTRVLVEREQPGCGSGSRDAGGAGSIGCPKNA